MNKILLVCMGNICRSPMAEGVVRNVFNKYKIEAEIDSAGTIGFHAGESPDYRAKAELMKHGINISDLRARKITVEDFEYYDYIYTMDHNNHADLLQMVPSEFKHKIEMFMNLSVPGKNIPVPDPYYGGDQGFTKVYEMINKSAIALAEKIKAEKI